MMTAQELFNKAFDKLRLPRSEEYKKGVLTCLHSRLTNDRLVNPYSEGTAESDAFLAGIEEGHMLIDAAVRLDTIKTQHTDMAAAF